MRQEGRITTLVLMLGLSILLCSAKAEKSNTDTAHKDKASSIKPQADPKRRLPDKAAADSPGTETTADIPLLPQDEADRANLQDGVTAKANIAASPAQPPAKSSGSGSIKVSLESRLSKAADNTGMPIGPPAEAGDAIVVGSTLSALPSSFRGGAVASSKPEGPAPVAAKPPPGRESPPPAEPRPKPPQVAGSSAAAQKAAAPPQRPVAPDGARSKATNPAPAPSQGAGEAAGLSAYFDSQDEALEPLADGEQEPAAAHMVDPAEVTDDTSLNSGTLLIGSARVPGAAAGKGKTLADAIRDDGEEGSAVPEVNAWQSLLALAAVLALFVAAAALYARLKRRGTPQAPRLNVIEEIGLGQGRQILIVEVLGDALVLGMTPQSINLLDKVPVDSFASDYRGSVDAILAREAMQPRRWAERPAFRSELRSALNGPRASGVSAPARQFSLGELRRSRQPATPVHNLLPASDRQGKNELIDRIREQLQRLED